MLKISFTNAEVSDHGYGLEVNGKSLEDIISTALGTKLKGNGGYGSGLPSFNSNSCDVTVIINPHNSMSKGVFTCYCVKLWSLLVWLWQRVINPLHLSRD